MSCENVLWQPGDVLVVRPQNSDDQVDELFSIFNEHHFAFNASTIVQLREFDSGDNWKHQHKHFNRIRSIFFENRNFIMTKNCLRLVNPNH